MKGEKNAYHCGECHGYVVTIDVDDGVTPMFLACRVLGEPSDPANLCDGQMSSMMYPDEPWPATDGYGTEIPTEPTWEWYKPERVEYLGLSRPAKEHCDKGGLSLRQKEPANG